ncbi:hypothetical protein ACX0G7_10650 [Flavitalea antarctica]
MKMHGTLMRGLSALYQYPLRDKHIIFGIRGCLPKAALAGDFSAIGKYDLSHELEMVTTNFKTPRCTIGFWNTTTDKLSIFPGSTLPSKPCLFSNISSLDTFNILCPGNYVLTRGIHPRSAGFQNHDAFLMDGFGIVKIPSVIKRRTTLSFDLSKSRYCVLQPGDNLHAGRTEPANSNDRFAELMRLNYSSSGCITIAGQPAAFVKGDRPDARWNCWENFMRLLNGQAGNSIHFNFFLFNFSDLQKIASATNHLRFGSEGEDVARVQKTLSVIKDSRTGNSYYNNTISSVFDRDTAVAVLRFKEDFTAKKPGYELRLRTFYRYAKHFITH